MHTRAPVRCAADALLPAVSSLTSPTPSDVRVALQRLCLKDRDLLEKGTNAFVAFARGYVFVVMSPSVSPSPFPLSVFVALLLLFPSLSVTHFHHLDLLPISTMVAGLVFEVCKAPELVDEDVMLVSMFQLMENVVWSVIIGTPYLTNRAEPSAFCFHTIICLDWFYICVGENPEM